MNQGSCFLLVKLFSASDFCCCVLSDLLNLLSCFPNIFPHIALVSPDHVSEFAVMLSNFQVHFHVSNLVAVFPNLLPFFVNYYIVSIFDVVFMVLPRRVSVSLLGFLICF